MEEYRRGKYYVERHKSNNQYSDMLVVKMDGFWRVLLMTGDADGKGLDRCKDWISKRKCFN
jgi:hypothetical protein